MSDTPKTDELAKREFITDGVWIRHARKLERENAELREALLNATTLLRRWNRNELTEDVFVETRKAIDAARKEAQPNNNETKN